MLDNSNLNTDRDLSHFSSEYRLLIRQVEALIAGESDLIANLANVSAVLFNGLTEVNWAGFYLYKDEQLVLGPFQGQAACIRIPIGQGVCGTVAANLSPLVVENVHDFDGHIACDAASNSEIVIPIVVDDVLVGVLDIDSPSIGRFDNQDKAALCIVVELIVESIKHAENH
jgi:GAF domain-containing protein